MDPNTCILGTLGGHSSTFGLILLTGAAQEAPEETPWSQGWFFVSFVSWILGLSWGPLWGLFDDFSEFCGVKGGG